MIKVIPYNVTLVVSVPATKTTQNKINSNDPDISGTVLDASKNYTGYNISNYDISKSHILSDLSSNTSYAIRTFARIGNMRNTTEDISMAIVTHRGTTKPFIKQTLCQ